MKNRTILNVDGRYFDLPDSIKDAMVQMMKHLVSNEWNQDTPKNEIILWLSSGTRLSPEDIEKITDGQKLFDENYIAGMEKNPFKDVVEEQRIKRKQERER